ncbi:MAG: hypothetical protein NDI69_18250, partial [Bacteriovoracaceae bacterium]|nr:hypothetical protein [Bacteriovoracaceae bacterium]
MKNGKEECKKLNGNLEMKAYFPDPTVDVTNQVKITKKSNTYSYSFQTPPLKAGDRNTFTLIVGPMNNHLKEILTIKAKLDRRIDFIEERILKYKLSNKNEKHVSSLQFLMQKLMGVSNKIDIAIKKEPLIVAKYSRPIQVESDTLTPYYYHSTFDGQRLVLSIPEGLPRIDEKLTINAEITNHSFKETTKKARDEKYKAKLYIDGILSQETNDFSNPAGKHFAFSHSLSDHQEGKSREVRLELYSLLKSSSSKGKNSKPKYQLVGSIELPLPKPLKRRDQIPPVIALDLQDNLKLNDSKLLLSGTITDVSDVNYALYLNNQLLIESESKLIQHELSLNQGQNNLKIIAQDIWGNSAEVIKIISVDSILPIISTTQNYNKLTNQASLLINAQVFDQNQVISKIFHNGQEVHSTDLKEIAFAVKLAEGSNTIKIESIDNFGNIALPLEISGIVLDTLPPVIAFSHSPTIPNPDQEITVDASASSDLSGIKSYSVHASGILLASSTSNIL